MTDWNSLIGDFDLAGKDYFTPREAAHYCGMDERVFAAFTEAYGFVGRLYARADLAAAIEEASSDPLAHKRRMVTAASGRYALAKDERTPRWADKQAIAAIYENARRRSSETGTAYAVDHVIPLRGERVSGLHVHTNLRIIPSAENASKRHRFDV